MAGITPYTHESWRKTNADCIRSMSDTELAKWMYEHVRCRNCPCNPCVTTANIDMAVNSCENALLEWLRKEATDG